MSNPKQRLSQFQKSEKEKFLDAIMGADEEMDDELAREILESYGIDENQLIDKFKECLRAELRQIPAGGAESENLGKTLRGIANHHRDSAPESVAPKDWIANLMNNAMPPPPAHSSQPLYSFHNRDESEMSDHDKGILDDLKAELENEDE